MERQQQTIDFYDRIAGTYDEVGYSKEGKYYPANLYRLELSKKVLAEIPRGRVLDAGCGTGLFLAHLAEEGYDCAGCDFSGGMLEQARGNLAKVTDDPPQLVETSLADLSMFEDDAFDHVFSLGVFPYIPESDEGDCYREIARVIKPGGYFVSAHENEIFDTFTFNKYTLRFFDRNIAPLLEEASPGIDVAALREQLATLMTNPTKPVNVDPKRSGRDFIEMRPENPLTYPEKLKGYGFKSEDFLYYHYHALPPLLRNDSRDLLELSSKLELDFARRWQGLFMSSTFINISRAVGR